VLRYDDASHVIGCHGDFIKNFIEIKDDMKNFIEQMRKEQLKEQKKRLKEEMIKDKIKGKRQRNKSEECLVF
jgi:hypothetical protein